MKPRKSDRVQKWRSSITENYVLNLSATEFKDWLRHIEMTRTMRAAYLPSIVQSLRQGSAFMEIMGKKKHKIPGHRGKSIKFVL